MALLKQGFLGDACGKLGNVVFSRWRDLQTVRQYQPDVDDANTEAQQKQRSRMLSLLQFLKPINKTFIRFFNSSLAKATTPWAKAIKDNMPAVCSDGCVNPNLFSLGNPRYPAFEISKATYNPIIDLCSVEYKPNDLTGCNDPYPYIATSGLGKYKSVSGLPEFNTSYLSSHLPSGYFYSRFTDQVNENEFNNYWEGIWLWNMNFDTYKLASYPNPNDALTEPSYICPTNFIEGFNTVVTANPIPSEAIQWDYSQIESMWFLDLSLDIKLIELENLSAYTMISWGVALPDIKYAEFEAKEWNLSATTMQIELSEEGFNGGIVWLYAVFNDKGEQVGRFNRFYINKGTSGKEHGLFDQLFYSTYCHPTSFLLPDNFCGFCGNFYDEFLDFINKR